MAGKWNKAKEEVQKTEEAFEDLSGRLTDATMKRWEEEEQEALEEGGDALAVYGVRLAEGQWAIAIKYAIGC